MDKNEIISKINSVMRTLDTGISVTGVHNAGNLAGCFMILDDVVRYLAGCDITPMNQSDTSDE